MSPRATSTRCLNPSRDGDSPTALGSLGQGLTTLQAKKFFPISNLNLPCCNLRPLQGCTGSTYFLLRQPGWVITGSIPSQHRAAAGLGPKPQRAPSARHPRRADQSQRSAASSPCSNQTLNLRGVGTGPLPDPPRPRATSARGSGMEGGGKKALHPSPPSQRSL